MLSALSLQLRECRKCLKQRDNESNITKYKSFKQLFKTEVNQSFHYSIDENLDSLNKTPGHQKVSQSNRGGRNKASLGVVKNAQGNLASAPEYKLDILKVCFFTGKHLSNEIFNQRNLTTDEREKRGLLSI